MVDIRIVENQTEENCLFAINLRPNLFKYILKPSYSVKKLAVEKDPFNIRYIPDGEKTEELCLIAVRGNSLTIKLIKNQTESLCLEAVKTNAACFKHCKIKTPIVCENALVNSASAFNIYYMEQTEDLCRKALNLNTAVFNLIENKTDDLYELAIEKSCNNFTNDFFILMNSYRNKTKDFCLKYFKDHFTCIKYVKMEERDIKDYILGYAIHGDDFLRYFNSDPFIKEILGIRDKIKSGDLKPKTLNEWLIAYAFSLCALDVIPKSKINDFFKEIIALKVDDIRYIHLDESLILKYINEIKEKCNDLEAIGSINQTEAICLEFLSDCDGIDRNFNKINSNLLTDRVLAKCFYLLKYVRTYKYCSYGEIYREASKSIVDCIISRNSKSLILDILDGDYETLDVMLEHNLINSKILEDESFLNKCIIKNYRILFEIENPTDENWKSFLSNGEVSISNLNQLEKLNRECTIKLLSMNKIAIYGNDLEVERFINNLGLNPDEISYILNQNQDAIKYFKSSNLKYEDALKCVNHDGSYFEYIKSETIDDNLCLAALNSKYPYLEAFSCIKNQDESICYHYIEKYPEIIEYIKNPTDGMNYRAVFLKPETIRCVKNQTLDLCIMAYKRNGGIIPDGINNIEAITYLNSLNDGKFADLNRNLMMFGERLTEQECIDFVSQSAENLIALNRKYWTKNVLWAASKFDENIKHIPIEENKEIIIKMIRQLGKYAYQRYVGNSFDGHEDLKLIALYNGHDVKVNTKYGKEISDLKEMFKFDMNFNVDYAQKLYIKYRDFVHSNFSSYYINKFEKIYGMKPEEPECKIENCKNDEINYDEYLQEKMDNGDIYTMNETINFYRITSNELLIDLYLTDPIKFEDAFRLIGNKSKDLICKAININPFNLQYLDESEQSEDICMLALAKNPKCYTYIIKPTKFMKIYSKIRI